MQNRNDSQKEALKFLREHNVAMISTASETGEPQASVVYYFVDDILNLYFATGRETRKFKNILANPRVAFAVGCGPNIITVQGGGTAKVERSIMFLRKFIEMFDISKASSFWPVLRLLHPRDVVVVKITPTWLVFLDLDNKAPDSYQRAFKQVIP